VGERENVSVSFIVRIWLEEAAHDHAEALWRGSVTHAPSGDKRYFNSLAHLVQHLALYLDTMDVASERDAGTTSMPGGAAREEGQREE
jgi:hypothetical protein